MNPGNHVLKLMALLCLCLCSSPRQSQAATLDDFVGVRWGTSIEEAKKIVLSNPRLMLDKQEDGILGSLNFQGGSYMGKPALRWFFTFANDKFCWGFVDFQLDRDRHPMSQLRQFKQMLVAKYGKPFLEQDSHPHSDPSWKECLVTKPFFKSDWHLTTSGPEPQTTTVRLFLHAKTMDSAFMRLVYGNEVLAAEREKMERDRKSGALARRPARVQPASPPARPAPPPPTSPPAVPAKAERDPMWLWLHINHPLVCLLTADLEVRVAIYNQTQETFSYVGEVLDETGSLALSGDWNMLIEKVKDGMVVSTTSLRPEDRPPGKPHELKGRGSEDWKFKLPVGKWISTPGNYRFQVSNGTHSHTGRVFRVAASLETPDWISLSYTPDKKVYSIGEPISVHFALKNNGTDEFHFEEGGDYRGASRHLRYLFTAESDQGVKATDPKPNQMCLGGLGQMNPHVKPGGVYAVDLPLLAYLKFAEPGKYVVKCYQAMGFGAPVEAVKNAGYGSYSYGGSFEIELKPITQQQATDIIKSFLAKPDRDERKRIFFELYHPSYLNPLMELLKTENDNNKCDSLVTGIGSIMTVESTRCLIALAHDDRVRVRAAAWRCLSWRLPDPRDTGKAKQDSPFQFYSGKDRLQDVKASWSESLRPDLLNLLKKGLESPHLDEVGACAYCLGALGETNTVELLAAAADRVAPGVPVSEENNKCAAQIANAGSVLAQLGGQPCKADKSSSPGRLAVWANMIRAKPEYRTGDWQDLLSHMMDLDCATTRMAAIRWLPKEFNKRDQIPWKKLFMEKDMQIWWHAIQVARETFPANVKAITQECLKETSDSHKRRDFDALLKEIDTRTSGR